MKAFKILLDDNIMKSTQHTHGGREGNESRGKWCVLRKVTEKAGSKTQNTKQMFLLGFLLQDCHSSHRDPSS